MSRSADGSTPRIDSVVGGAGGTAAEYDDMTSLAGVFASQAGELTTESGAAAKVLVNPDLLASAPLSPASFARAEAAVVEATTGSHGIAVHALEIEADALLLRVTVTAYRAGDELVAQGWAAFDYLAGRALGTALPGLLVAGGLGVLALAAANPALTTWFATHPDDLKALEAGGAAELQHFVEDHPDLVQHMVDGGGGLMDGLLSLVPPDELKALGIDPFHPTTESAAGALAGLWVDGKTHVSDATVDVNASPAGPASLADVLTGMQYTNGQRSGTIDVTTVTSVAADGSPQTRYVVDIPGTQSWALPGHQDSTAADLGANVRLTAGEDTAYSRGVIEAMRRAGVPPGAHVMLVGHSQGGMTAAHVASEPAVSGTYSIDYVVTAGSPIAHATVPVHTTMLSLEGSGDVVPLLDGAPNRDTLNHITVRFDDTTGTLAGNHDLSQYIGGARAVDSSQDPGLADLVGKMRSDGYLSGGHASTQQVVVTSDRSHG